MLCYYYNMKDIIRIDNRKVVRIGRSSYGVILPISWIRKHNLESKILKVTVTADKIEITPGGEE